MAGIAQRSDAVPRFLRDLDAMRDGLGCYRLAEAEMPVEHREGAAIGHQLGILAAHHEAGLAPFDVARHAHHAVAVMAREVGAQQVLGDAVGLGAVAFRGEEDVAHQRFEVGRGDQEVIGGHGALASLSQRPRVGAAGAVVTIALARRWSRRARSAARKARSAPASSMVDNGARSARAMAGAAAARRAVARVSNQASRSVVLAKLAGGRWMVVSKYRRVEPLRTATAFWMVPVPTGCGWWTA